MAYAPVNDGDLAIAPSVQQIIDSLSGVIGAGQPIRLTTLESETDYALQLHNIGLSGLTLYAYQTTGTETIQAQNTHTRFDTNTLFIDNVNHRVGIGTSTPTAALDVNGTIVMRNGALYNAGPVKFDVEAYANAADLNTNGTFKITVDCSYAINAAAAAVRTTTISDGVSTYGWPYARQIIFNSPIYTLSKPANLSHVQGCWIGSRSGASFYSTDSWSTAGAYRSGVADVTGNTISAANSPMFDITCTPGSTFENLLLAGQKLLGPAGTAPTTKPAAGWLNGAEEPWTGASWNALGGIVSNNNNKFINCSAIGWFGCSPWMITNNVITEFIKCGGQQYNNLTGARVFYAAWGTTSVNNPAPDAAGAIDSPFYPNLTSPAVGNMRMLRQIILTPPSPNAIGFFTFIDCEFHDMVRLSDGLLVPDSLQASMLFHRAVQVKMISCVISSSGTAGIELQGTCRGLTLDTVDFYNDSSNSGTNPQGFLYNNSITTAAAVQQTQINGLTMNTPVTSAAIIGLGNAAFSGLIMENNGLNGACLYRTTSGFTDPDTTETLTGQSRIDCGGLTLIPGGSIGSSVTLLNPGAITLAGTATDKSTKETSAGALSVYSTVTSRSGDIVGRHLLGNGTALATGDIALSAGWGAGGGGTTKSLIRGTDTEFAFRVTNGTGAGANPTITITFKSAFANAPVALVQMFDNGVKVNTVFWGETTTTLAITVIGVPTDAHTFDFRVHVLGH